MFAKYLLIGCDCDILGMVELFLQLVYGEASLGARVGGLGGVHPLGQLVYLALELGPALDKLIDSVNPFPSIKKYL